jgi:5-methylcytosine-specific restriction endonuclease McrA
MQIVEKLKLLVANERKISAEIIEHIQEIDQKKIYLQMGFANLYSFLTEYIGYTAASAQRRIEAARLLTSVPEVKENLKSGSLNLSQVSMVSQMIRQKQKEQPAVKFNPSDKKALIESVKGLSLENSQKILSQTLDLEVKAYEKQKLQADESIRLEMTLTKLQNEMLKKVKSLMSHVNPNASTAEVFEYLANDYLKRKDPLYLTSHKPKTASATEVPARYKPSLQMQMASKRRKTISASVKRAVWQRDHGMCQHKNQTTGNICGSDHLLEFDHIKRLSYGGDDTSQNLRLLCKAHNLWRG